MNGYSHPRYAGSLAEFGTPRSLPRSGGWLLERRIAQTPYRDAMGCYPLFACHDWSKLESDLEPLSSELVSVAIVADPFGNHDIELLRKCFPTLVIPFKEHLVTDVSQAPESFVDAHHRRKARKALKTLEVERCEDPTLFVDEWNNLYAKLIQRHGIHGLSAFSATSFKAQLAVPGISMFRATHGNETVGMTLWYTDREIAYYHLGAYSDLGYELAASFGLFWRVLEYFRSQGLQWLNLGAGAGVSSQDRSDGLNRFKRGWSTGMRTAYFCGRIFDQSKYEEVMRDKQVTATDYFPAYRKDEFS
jgi:Acetyltransferase (GNAT) domain